MTSSGPAEPSTESGAVAWPSPPGTARRAPRWGRWASAVASYLVVAFALVTLNFVLPRAMPGDPIAGLLAQGSAGFTLGEQSRAAFARYYQLDGSLAHQYRHYLSRLFHGDLGRSIVTNTPVAHEIGRRLGWTLLLVGGAVLIATVVGVVAGVQAGWRRDRPLDRVLLAGLLAVREFPAFLLGSLLLLVFAVKLRWLPLAGAETPFSTYGLVGRVEDVGRHLLLPLLVLVVGLTVGNYLVMRAGMVSELGADYLLLGRAKGLRPRRLKYRYAARNALLPLVSLTALQLGFVVTGDVLVERVFSYPGLGGLLFDSIAARDYPVIQGAFLVVSLSVVACNGLADLLYRRLDPRTAP